MTIVRKLISSESYQGRRLSARHMGPDLLAYVDDMELSGFYVDASSAIAAGKRHVDAELKAAKEGRAR